MTTGYAETVAADIIAQLNDQSLNIAYAAEYQRMVVSELETMAPAGGASSEMQIVIAPIDILHHGGQGEWQTILALGVLFDILVADPHNDAEMAPLELFVDQVCQFLMSQVQFATAAYGGAGFGCQVIKPIYGDHYLNHLRNKSEFHVPALLHLVADWGSP